MNRRGLETQELSDALELALQWLQTAKRPVCIAGRGVVWAGASGELLQLSDCLPSLRVASTPSAKGVVPESSGVALGVWGFSGHDSARCAVLESDVLLIAGSRLHEPSSAAWHPRLEGPRVIRIDCDASRVLPTRVDHIGLVGDVGAIFRCLSQHLRPLSRQVGGRAPQPVQAIPKFEQATSACQLGGGLVKPQALFEVMNRIAEEVPISADAGNSMCWAIEWLCRRTPGLFQVSVDWGSMGFALPAALGTLLARGHTAGGVMAPAIAVAGDGSLAMAGGDLHTAVELGVPLIVVALNDAGAGMVRAGSQAWFGDDRVPDPTYRCRMNLSEYARSLGAHGELITSVEDFEAKLLEALKRPGPTLLDVLVDPSQVPAAIRARVAGLIDSSAQGGGIC